MALLIGGITLFGCAGRGGFSPESWKIPVDGEVSSISRADLAAAVAAANAERIWAVHVINRDRVHVDISDDLHEVGNYDKTGRHYIERVHGDPMYVVVRRVRGQWEGVKRLSQRTSRPRPKQAMQLTTVRFAINV